MRCRLSLRSGGESGMSVVGTVARIRRAYAREADQDGEAAARWLDLVHLTPGHSRENANFRDSRTGRCFVTVDDDRRGLSVLHVIRPSVVKHPFVAQSCLRPGFPHIRPPNGNNCW